MRVADAECFRPQGNIIYQTLNHETVIINLDNGRYYSLNAAASFIWDQLVKQYSIGEIEDALARRAKDGAKKGTDGVGGFVEELVGEELIVRAEGKRQDLTPLDVPEMDPEMPTMEKFTDMEKLIPLDPIHQVGAMGWPFRQENAEGE